MLQAKFLGHARQAKLIAVCDVYVLQDVAQCNGASENISIDTIHGFIFKCKQIQKKDVSINIYLYFYGYMECPSFIRYAENRDFKWDTLHTDVKSK